METQQYHRIKNYLLTNKLPDSLGNKQQKQLKSKAQFFEVKNNQLYKKNHCRKTRNQLLRVIQPHEIEPILYLLHNHPTGAYIGVDKVFRKLRDQYYWPQMFEN